MVKISIIIVNYNGCKDTEQCLESIECTIGTDSCEIFVIDNNSSDGSIESIKLQFPEVKILPQQNNLGFGKANNIGAKASSCEFLFFLNNDTILTEDVITPLCSFLQEDPLCGAVGPLLLNADGTYQHSFGCFPSILNEWRIRKETGKVTAIPADRSAKEVDWVTFAAVMIRRAVFEEVGGFDENYFMYFEDSDFCLRLLKKGYRSVYLPKCSLIHARGASRTKQSEDKIAAEYRRSQLYYYKKHKSMVQTMMLRFYLTVKYLFLSMKKTEHDNAKNILKSVIFKK
jgi:GT2 family glycosyltransferase